MSAPLLILFDIDGTLLFTGGAGRIALARTFEQVFGIVDMDSASRRVEYGGRTDPAILRDLAHEAGLPADAMDRQGEKFERVYLKELSAEMGRADSPARLLPGVAHSVEQLGSRTDVRLALLTGNSESGARAKLEPFDLNRWFPTGGFGSDHEDRREVAAVARRRAENHFGSRFAAERVVVIGDTRHDIDCAHHHGFRCLAVLTGSATHEDLAAHAPAALLPGLDPFDRLLESLGLQPDDPTSDN